MTRLEYLKRCITSGNIIKNKKWYITCFAIPLLKEEVVDIDKLEPYSIVTKLDGLYFVDILSVQENGTHSKQLVKITDYKKDTPLFSFQELIEVDTSWLPSIKSKQETKIGVLIINSLCIYAAVGTKLDYLNQTIKMDEIESILVNRVKNDDVAGPNDITVKEMINCINKFTFLSNLATLINIAATPKAITPPPGIDKIRKDLAKEYEGQLHDPVKVVELETRLNQIDQDYLADDPAAKKIFNKKSRTARKKMFLIYGETKDFVAGSNNVVVPSLTEGVDTSPENFPLYMNDLRYGSFSRGASTQLSGYSYKVLQRSLSGLAVSKDPCNTTKGLKREINAKNYNKLVNRYIKEGGWKLISTLDEAKAYIDKTVEIRSSMYCTSPGNTVCYKCMSENYKNSPNGITNLAATISDTLMNLFLKMMHGTTTEVIEIKMTDLVT